MGFKDPATRRRIILTVSVLALAFSAGHIMQNVLAKDTDIAVRGLAPNASEVMQQDAEGRSLPVPPAATLVPFEPPEPAVRDRITDDPPLPELPLEDASLTPLERPCSNDVDAIAGDQGLIWIEVVAPCLTEQSVRISHGELGADWQLDGNGRLSVDLPAFSDQAVVTVSFADGDTQSLYVEVPEVRDLFRAALVWEGEQVLALHAIEFGAAYGGEGHTNAALSEDRGAVGSFTVLGDGSGAMAEVYTFPAAAAPSSGAVRLSVEAEVTSETCARTVDVTSVQTDRLGGFLSRRLSLAMPTCELLGDMIVIDTLYRDLEIAAR